MAPAGKRQTVVHLVSCRGITVVDHCTRGMPRPDRVHILGRPTGGRELAILFERRGQPATVVSDQRTTFTSNAILTFADDRKVD